MKIVLCVALMMSATIAVAQNIQQITTSEQFAVRLQGGANLSLFSADFRESADILDCGVLNSGSGLNFVAHVIAEFPLSNSLGIGAGVGFVNRSGSLQSNNVYPSRDPITGAPITLSTNGIVDATLPYLEFQPDLRLAVINEYENRTLGLVVGPRLAFPLSASYIQSEQIVSPENATFVVDGSRTQQRELGRGDFTNVSSVLFGGSIGLEALLPLSKSMQLVPSVSIDYFFNSVTTDVDWSAYGVRAEVGVRFSSSRSDTVFTSPEPELETSYAPPMIAINFPSFDGEIVTGDQLVATLPIVPAVFFDTASASIPVIYRRSIDGSNMSADPVDAHLWVLPRIAAIAVQNPNSRIELIGASGGDVSVQLTELGIARAEAVKEAFINMGVPADRISVTGVDYPAAKSNPDYAAGRHENRRVDIRLKNASLQRWVTAETFAQLRGKLGVRIARLGGEPTPNDQAPVSIRGIVDTSLTAGRLTTISYPVHRSVETDQDTIHVGVEVSSVGVASTRDTILTISDLPRRQINLQTSDFKAILRFDYNSADLSAEVKQLLEQLCNKLPNNSTITILGSTDALGSQERNKVLSEQRANNTKAYINSITNGRLTIESGTSNETFSDSTPEGRFLNRSIRITAQTPKQ